jgi:hypothetical protein
MGTRSTLSRETTTLMKTLSKNRKRPSRRRRSSPRHFEPLALCNVIHLTHFPNQLNKPQSKSNSVNKPLKKKKIIKVTIKIVLQLVLTISVTTGLIAIAQPHGSIESWFELGGILGPLLFCADYSFWSRLIKEEEGDN